MPPETPADTGASSALPTPADSAAPVTESQEFTEDFQIPTGGQERHDWQMGKLPAKKDAKTLEPKETVDNADSAPANPAETAADSAAAPPQKKGKTQEDSERRWRELSENYGNAQRRIEELERKLSAPPAKSDTPNSQPAKVEAAKEPMLDDKDANGAFKYKDIAAFQKDHDAWLREDIRRELRETSEKTQKDQKLTESKAVIAKVWSEKVGKARQTYPDFDEIALNTTLPIHEGSVTDLFVLDSDHGAEVLYYLGKNPAELTRINALNPLRQARELYKIEDKLFSAPAPSAPKITRAPAPPHEVSGKGTVPPDETEQALEDDDFQAYKAAENRKAILKAKGK